MPTAATLASDTAGTSQRQNDAVGAAALRCGQRLLLRGAEPPAEGPAYAACFGAPVALGFVEGGYFVSTRVFNLPT